VEVHVKLAADPRMAISAATFALAKALRKAPPAIAAEAAKRIAIAGST
jgi:hypothetical protein